MTLTEYYEDNVKNKIKRRREEYNYREYKPGRNVEMRHDIFAAQIRLRYMSIDWRLREIGERHRIYRPLIMTEWEANLERLMNEASREESFIRNAPRFTNGDFDGNWIERGRRGGE